MRHLICCLFLLTFLTGCGVDWFPAPGSTVVITTAASLPNATQGTSYSQQLAAFGGTTPFSWAVTSGTLPTGLTLSTGGLLSGTPTVSGTSTFNITVTDSSSPALTGSLQFTLLVAASGSPITLNAGEPAVNAVSGQTFLVPSGTQITVNGTTQTVTASTTTIAGATIFVPTTATGSATLTITVTS